MIRQKQNQWWIVLIAHFLITHLSSANNPDFSDQNHPPKMNTENSTFGIVNTTYDVLSSEKMEVCLETWSCHSGKNIFCYCDNLCTLFGDCCEDNFRRSTTEISFSQSAPTNKDINYEEKHLESTQQLKKPLAKNLYKCIYDEYAGSKIYTVFGCPVEYTNKYVRKNCEQPEEADKLLHVPVSGVFPNETSSVKFYNYFCAICHGLTDYNFWKPFLSCLELYEFLNLTGSFDEYRHCSPYFFVPEMESLRSCQHIIDECPANLNNHDKTRCEQGPYLPIGFIYESLIYKNKGCALCHFDRPQSLTCSEIIERIGALISSLYKQYPTAECDTASIYDVYRKKCRTLYSPRFCNESNLTINNLTIPCPDCQLIRLDENEYSHVGDSIRFQKSDITINKSLLHYIDDKVYICSSDYIEKKASSNDKFYEIELYSSLFVVSLSMFALIVTFCVYVSFRSLRNVPGKMSMNLIASMFLANLLLALSNVQDICTVVAICLHYAYLVSFFWMNALSFDAWNTFSKTTTGDRSKHCYKYYCIYCWITPLMIVSVGIFVQFTQFDIFPPWLSPKYGPPLCWISNKWALLIFFAGPLFLLILCNVVFYTLTIRAIYRTNKSSDRLLSKKNKGMFLVYLKLCFIMGVNWIFALLHIFTELTIIRFISVFLISSQGLWVGCSYLFSKEVRRQLKGKIAFLRPCRRHTERQMNTKTVSTSSESHFNK